MKALPYMLLPALALGAALPLAQAQNVSVNAVITGEVAPGVYGQVVIGDRGPPPVLYAQPVIVEAPVVVGGPPPEPIYLHVPPGHAKNWRKHCHEYHACNRPVYFVKSAEYEPGYRADRGRDEHEHEHGHRDKDERGEREHGDHDRDQEHRD